MSEPITSTMEGVAGWKLLGGLAGAGAIGAGLAALVVMCLSPPRSKREWVPAIISTVVLSVGGGAAVIMKFGLLAWAQNPVGLVAMISVVFACGLPAWAVVRWLFNFIERRRDKDLAEVVDEVRDVVAGSNHG